MTETKLPKACHEPGETLHGFTIDRVTPLEDVRAVAYEATGQYERALETYQKALKSAPGDRNLRANYSRFVEFYQSFKPDKSAEDLASEEAAESDGGAEEPSGDDTDSGESGNG